jgi:GDP-L-fucose synthase
MDQREGLVEGRVSAARILLLGATGLVGAAIRAQLAARGVTNVLAPGRETLDLADAAAVAQYFGRHRPEQVILAAGKTGGVYANDTYRAEFIYDNLAIQTNVIHQAYLHDVQRLLYFGCSSMYPRLSSQPIRESDLLSGPLEPTNEPFAVAKLAGWKMCESYNRQYGTSFITLVPTNVYGPGQHYEPLNSLVVPALIQECHDAKLEGRAEMMVWGSGRPARDFVYVDDLADAALFVMGLASPPEVANVGTGRDYTIRELAESIKDVVGFTGRIVFDSSRPDGVLNKLQDTSVLGALGWSARTPLRDGLQRTYEAFLVREGASAS